MLNTHLPEPITMGIGCRNGRFVTFSLDVEVSEDRPESWFLEVEVNGEFRAYDLSDMPHRLRDGLLQILADLTNAPGAHDITVSDEGEVH